MKLKNVNESFFKMIVKNIHVRKFFKAQEALPENSVKLSVTDNSHTTHPKHRQREILLNSFYAKS